MFNDVCTNPDILKITMIIKNIFDILKIVIPLILIIVVSIDAGKYIISGSNDELSKKAKQITARIIAAVLVFLVPTILGFCLKFIENGTNFASCLTNANPKTIASIILNRADNLVAKAEKSLNESDVAEAKSAIKNVQDKDLRESYNSRIEKVQTAINKNKPAPSKPSNPVTPTNPNNTGYFNNSIGNAMLNTKYPYYNQCDKRWSPYNLTKDKSYDTCYCGCGYTSLSMVLSGLNNDASITPASVISYLQPSSVSKCAIDDQILISSKLKNKYNVNANLIFGRNTPYSSEGKKAAIVSELKKNRPVILLVPGHYIVLTGINGNKITSLNSAYASYNASYTIDELYNKYYNYKNRCTDNNNCGFKMAISYSK